MSPGYLCYCEDLAYMDSGKPWPHRDAYNETAPQQWALQCRRHDSEMLRYLKLVNWEMKWNWDWGKIKRFTSLLWLTDLVSEWVIQAPKSQGHRTVLLRTAVTNNISIWTDIFYNFCLNVSNTGSDERNEANSRFHVVGPLTAKSAATTKGRNFESEYQSGQSTSPVEFGHIFVNIVMFVLVLICYLLS